MSANDSTNAIDYTFVIGEAEEVSFDADKFKQWFSEHMKAHEKPPEVWNHEYVFPKAGMPSVENELKALRAKYEDMRKSLRVMFDNFDSLIEGDMDFQVPCADKESRIRFLIGKGYEEARITRYLTKIGDRMDELEAQKEEATQRAERAEELAVQHKLRADKLEEELRNVEG